MRSSTKLEKELKTAISQTAGTIKPSENMFTEINKKIERENKGEQYMRIGRYKKAKGILVTCVLLILTTATCFAATRYFIFDKFPSKEEVQEQAGISPKIVEEFQNGYTCIANSIDTEEMLSDGSNILDLRYLKDDSIVHFHASKAIEGESALDDIKIEKGEAKEEVSIAPELLGIYISAKAKLVPMDFEMTKQDKKDEKSGLYMFLNKPIDDVKIVDTHSLMWEDSGVFYILSEYDGMLDKQQIMDMAKEIANK
ncbi:MAG: hypothetical protein VB095_08360 [Anaerovorax sp.]|nr:hypothetical protein [Anaerovorax sp.]